MNAGWGPLRRERRDQMPARILLALVLASASFLPSTQPVVLQQQDAPAAVVWSPSTGRQALIPVREQFSALQAGGLMRVYEAEVTPAILASVVDSRQKWDSSSAVLVTIWMYYNAFDYGGATWVSVSRYATRWQLYDSSISMRNARMNAGCLGDSWDGPPEECEPPASQQRSIGAPTSGTIYSLYPSWAGHYIEITPEGGYQAGSSTVQLKRGTATWWLSICIYQGSCGV